MGKKILFLNQSKSFDPLIALCQQQTDLTISEATDVQSAIKLFHNRHFDLVICDLNQLEATHQWERARLTKIFPKSQIIQLTSFRSIQSSDDILRYGASDYIMAKEELVQFLSHFTQRAHPSKKFAHLKRTYIKTLDVLMSLVELHDPYFQGYSHAVMAYSVAVAREMGLEDDLMDEVTVAALLHDIGKYVMKQQVLLAERQLSSQEMVTIQNHCRMAVKILEGVDFPWRVKDIIYSHHERYDGSGYPEGKRGRGIPLGARIIATVSGYLAMTANRPHRLAMNRDEAVAELKNNAGTQFDPEVVEVLLNLLERSPIEKTMGFSRHILLVDQEQDFLSVSKLALARQSFHPVVAESAQEALDQDFSISPDLVVANVNLPDMDGITFIKKFREKLGIPDLPFIFIADTGTTSDQDKISGLLQGAGDFLTKPFNMTELLIRANMILSRYGARRDGHAHEVAQRGILGNLSDLSLPEILEILHYGIKTALVTVEGRENEGRIYLENGDIKHAEYGALEGEDALHKLLETGRGKFRIEHGLTTLKQTVYGSTVQVLLQGMISLDKESQVKGS